MNRPKKKNVPTAMKKTPILDEFGVDFTNIRGLHANLSAVHHHLETARPALLFLTETQIKGPPDTSYLQYPGYALEERFLAKAGVCVFVRSDICCRRLRCMEDPSLSLLWVHVDLGSQSRVYGCLYRSHNGDLETTRLFDTLSRATDMALERFPTAEVIVLGDFNAHNEVWLGSQKTDHAGRAAHTFALSHGLTQLVSQPTRVPDVVGHAASLLDLLLTSRPTGYKVCVKAPLGNSDHCLVETTVPRVDLPPVKAEVRRIWHYRSADWEGMRNYFASLPWLVRCFNSKDPSTCASAIADEIALGMEYYIPSNWISRDDRSRPWFNGKCAKAVSAKNLAYRAWARGLKNLDPREDELKAAYNRATKSCRKVFKEAEAQRVSRIGESLLAHPTGSRSFWSLAKTVESNFCRSSLPPLRGPDGTLAHAARAKAELLADLFAANSRLDDRGASPPTLPPCGHTMPEIRFRQRDVRTELRLLDVRKSCGPDGIPALVLKMCAAELTPVVTRLYQLSYSSGCVPRAWKEANVQPVPKKGDRSDPANYRPIAITSVLCKVMERIINVRLMAYLEDHQLINDRQYGFRPKRSSGDLLAYIIHVWGEALDGHGEALAIGLDISKAFDRVWHMALLSKLDAYGLPVRMREWIADFLRERSIRVLVDGHASRKLSVNAGIPQGSVLSPTLFLLHINDMLNLGSNIHCYADDSTIHGRYTSRPAAGKQEINGMRESIVAELDRGLERISLWGDRNLVRFNADKTQVCAFSTKKSPFSPLPSLRKTPLGISDRLDILGMTLRCDLNHREHIERAILNTSRKLGILNRVRRFFAPEHRLLLYKAQIRSCAEYCSHLWDGSAKYLLDALDSMQRRAVRVIGDADITRCLEPLQLRRDMAALCVLYRLYHGECSEELFNLVPTSTFHSRDSRTGRRKHSHCIDRITSRTKRFGASFLCRTIDKWNALPAHVFDLSYNLGSFKRSVKKHLRPA